MPVDSGGLTFRGICLSLLEADTSKFGGDGRDRTDDIQLAKLALSQLSYIPEIGAQGETRTRTTFATSS